MELSNIVISKAIDHDVVKRSMIDETPPELSEEIIELDLELKRHIAAKLTKSLADGSHSVEVTVVESGKDSPFDMATKLLSVRNERFVELTKQLANQLTQAQRSGSIKAGTAFFLVGSCIIDNEQKRFVCIIKADPDSGIGKSGKKDKAAKYTYIKEVLMSDSQRLIKIAFLIEDHKLGEDDTKGEIRKTEDFSVVVFDHLMQKKHDVEASKYFYNGFLRCERANDSAVMTKKFYDAAHAYITGMQVDASEQFSLRGDLVSHFRSNRTTLDSRSFAMEVLPPAHTDPLVQHCRDRGITGAITKDTELIKTRLKRRTLKFTSTVTLYAPPEVLRDSVRVKGTEDGWTNIAIKGTIDEKI